MDNEWIVEIYINSWMAALMLKMSCTIISVHYESQWLRVVCHENHHHAIADKDGKANCNTNKSLLAAVLILVFVGWICVGAD